MKVLFLVAVLVACANASVISNIAEKLVPSFATGYVIKGEEAAPHSARYIISLSSKFTKHSHICGGTLISKEWIITAGHCVAKPVGMGVMAGLHTRSDVNEKVQAREVDFGKVHPSFGGGVGPYDIAILHVSKPFEFNQWVQPAILPVRREIHHGDSHLYGWGQPKAYVFTPAKTLQTVQSEILVYEDCKARLPENAPIAESNLCSDSLGKGISACNGDSGGPLVVERDGSESELVGVVSWGYLPCGVGNMPSIYTRVSAYVDWVVEVQSAYYKLF